MRPLFALLTFLVLLGLSACYRPLYGDKDFGEGSTTAETNLNRIAIANIPDANGQKLRNNLIDRFYRQGRPAKTDYELVVHIKELDEKIGIQKDATTTSARLTLTANYEVIDQKIRKKLFSGTSHSIVGYDTLEQQYATLTAKENAYSRALSELADTITTRVLIGLQKAQETK